jgi:uncharacterized cupin superfamily protein
MMCHWDEVPWKAHEHGELRYERQRLGAAAGSVEIGLSRYRIAPGARHMPLHVHADEEEIFFVLAGSGYSWQDDVVHDVRAGDTIVHLPQREAHTLIAGPDEPLEVLAFGGGSPTHLTTLPRAGVTWTGARWLPPHAAHPFEAEPPLGELPPRAPRPATIAALDDVAASSDDHGEIARTRRDLGRAAGSRRTGVKHVEVPPGKRPAPRHCHAAEEELFVILGGDGVVRLGDDEHPVRSGSVIARPAATGVAHDFRAGDDGLTLLAYGTRERNEICWYPDSQKVYLSGVGVIARVQRLDYWDGEG